MSIRVVCPNGHALNVRDDWAGKIGLCPICKGQVEVPTPSTIKFSEDSIADLLGRQGGQGQVAAKTKPKEASAGPQQTPKKSCDKCRQEIPKGSTICPHCRTFVGYRGEN